MRTQTKPSSSWAQGRSYGRVGITQVSPQPEKPARVLLVEDDTELGDDEAHAAAHRLAADLVLDKPFDVDDLRAAVRAAVPL